MKKPKVICSHAGKGDTGCRYDDGEKCIHSRPHVRDEWGESGECDMALECIQVNQVVSCVEVKK